MGLFGLRLFEKKQIGKLYDFAQHGLLKPNYGNEGFVTIDSFISGSKADKKTGEKKKPEALKKTPKELFELKTLNIEAFAINCSDSYINEQLDILHDKLEIMGEGPKPLRKGQRIEEVLLNEESGAVKYGRMEVRSMIERMANRAEYPKFESSFAFWPYTTNDAIVQLLDKYKHLEAVRADESIPDLPKDAIKAMQSYEELTEKVCGKKPIFYLIKEKKQRDEIARRRDPILLAQSPFGFFWQILGAWDKEIKFLDEI